MPENLLCCSHSQKEGYNTMNKHEQTEQVFTQEYIDAFFDPSYVRIAGIIAAVIEAVIETVMQLQYGVLLGWTIANVAMIASGNATLIYRYTPFLYLVRELLIKAAEIAL
jgi:hypothetical protein